MVGLKLHGEVRVFRGRFAAAAPGNLQSLNVEPQHW